MSEWINAAPYDAERVEKEVNGVIESSLTPEAEVLYRQHLEEDKQRRVAIYKARLFEAAQALDVAEGSEYRLAAD